MSKIIDLSLEIYDKSPVFPGDPEMDIRQFHSIGKTGYNVSCLSISSHAGTHIDAPKHFFDNGTSVDKIPLSKCVGQAFVLDFTWKKEKETITLPDLMKFNEIIKKNVRLIIKTGWYKVYPDKRYFVDMPSVSPDACRFLAEKKIACLAMDMPGVNYENFTETHKILLSKDILIVESLNNLDEIKEIEVFFAAVPLRVSGVDGSPCRAFAIEGLSDYETATNNF
jgi:arylformamidase